MLGTYPGANNVQTAMSARLFNAQVDRDNGTLPCLPADPKNNFMFANTTAAQKAFLASLPTPTAAQQAYMAANNLPVCYPNAPWIVNSQAPFTTTWNADPKHGWYNSILNINQGK